MALLAYMFSSLWLAFEQINAEPGLGLTLIVLGLVKLNLVNVAGHFRSE